MTNYNSSNEQKGSSVSSHKKGYTEADEKPSEKSFLRSSSKSIGAFFTGGMTHYLDGQSGKSSCFSFYQVEAANEALPNTELVGDGVSTPDEPVVMTRNTAHVFDSTL